jgi:hypothetical protein
VWALSLLEQSPTKVFDRPTKKKPRSIAASRLCLPSVLPPQGDKTNRYFCMARNIQHIFLLRNHFLERLFAMLLAS